MRDLLETHFEAIWVSGDETADRISRPFFQPGSRTWWTRYGYSTSRRVWFEHFGVEDVIEATLRHKVWLKSGGHIAIHPTEALVAIDVNTGRFVGEQDLEATVLQTNLEAAREVARQIRLRDLSGILVVDFIDMEEPENRAAVLDAIERELERDRAKSQVLGISEFGLVQITPQARTAESGATDDPGLPLLPESVDGSNRCRRSVWMCGGTFSVAGLDTKGHLWWCGSIRRSGRPSKAPSVGSWRRSRRY